MADFERDKSAGRLGEIVFRWNLEREIEQHSKVWDVTNRAAFFALGVDFYIVSAPNVGELLTIGRVWDAIDVKAHLWRSYDKRGQDLVLEVFHDARLIGTSEHWLAGGAHYPSQACWYDVDEARSIPGWTGKGVESVRSGRHAFRRIVWVDTNNVRARKDVWFASVRVDQNFIAFWDARPWTKRASSTH